MTPIKYPGSKNACAEWIISHFPSGYKTMTYLEPFFGSGAVFFAKEPSVIETINDINSDIVNFFKVLRDNPEILAYKIANTPWSREEYDLSQIPTSDIIEKARRFIIKYWFSIGAREEGFRVNIKKNCGNFGSFHTQLPNELFIIADRLKCRSNRIVQIENKDVFALIQKYNHKNCLIYLDPPYLMETRKNRRIYDYEFSNEQHIRLLQLIQESKSYIIISGYENALYDKFLGDWKKTQRRVIGQRGTKMETLWMNFNSYQYLLF